VFVAFEGPEGGGKSTALRQLADRWQSRFPEVPLLCSREPGAGELGARIREILLHGTAMPARSELFLFLADRSAHVTQILKPHLASGGAVFCDRYMDSTFVYQAIARGLDEGFVRTANDFAVEGLLPDLTLLFDLPVEVGLGRINDKDRLDNEPIAFHQKVREGFLRLAEENPSRYVVIDASQSPEMILEACWAAIETRRA
jgi:dTMP kinase